MRVTATNLNGACGVAHYYGFSDHAWDERRDTVESAPVGGIGLISAGFVDTEACRITYDKLCEKATLVYQSPVRRNANSGRKFFFAVFDKGRSPKRQQFQF